MSDTVLAAVAWTDMTVVVAGRVLLCMAAACVVSWVALGIAVLLYGRDKS